MRVESIKISHDDGRVWSKKCRSPAPVCCPMCFFSQIHRRIAYIVITARRCHMWVNVPSSRSRRECERGTQSTWASPTAADEWHPCIPIITCKIPRSMNLANINQLVVEGLKIIGNGSHQLRALNNNNNNLVSVDFFLQIHQIAK